MYTLNTSFTRDDLARFLAAGANVVVAKCPQDQSRSNVAWVVYRPTLENTLTWDDSYGLYATEYSIDHGTYLFQMARTEDAVPPSEVHVMAPAGYFTPSRGPGVPGCFVVQNEYDNLPKGFLTIGLWQDAMVNGEVALRNAVSADPVLYRNSVLAAPRGKVLLWVQASIRSSTVVTYVTSPVTSISFTSDSTMASVRYDAATGRFIRAGSTDAGAVMDHFLPNLL